MKCTPEIQQKVKDNMGLVGKVIKDKVHNLNGSGFYSYEDLYQIGYIGLCKAALTDKGGWNCQESCSLKNTQNSLSIIVQFADCNRCNCSSHIFGILSSSP